VAQDAGAPRDALAREVDDLFTDPVLTETRALLVLHDGELVAERYGEGYSAETRFISWSMAKTVTAVLIGMLVADGRLALDETPPIPAWNRAGDPRSAITLRHLLQMRSGLRHCEACDPIYDSSEVRMLFLDGRDDMAAWAEAQPLEADPGTRYEYSSNTTVILADIAARVLAGQDASADARRDAVAQYLEARLFGPLDMETMLPEYDARGTLIGGSLMHASARDWAKFGEFLRRHGAAEDGTQLVPDAWIDFMLTPSPASPHYGGQTWLNRPDADGKAMLFPDKAPASAFSAIGHLGQYVAVSPQQRVTVVRLGRTDDDARTGVVAAMGDIFALYPARDLPKD
jgi:CubicO group peptidase (beta-lactamase class C family)